MFGLTLLKYPTSSEHGAFEYLPSVVSLGKSSYLEIVFLTLSLGLLVYVFTSHVVVIFNDWSLDDFARQLASHSTRGSWREVAVSVDTEIRRVDKFRSVIGNTTLYVTGKFKSVVGNHVSRHWYIQERHWKHHVLCHW